MVAGIFNVNIFNDDIFNTGAVVVTTGSGHHDGMSQLFRPPELLHTKSRVGLLLKIHDITPELVKSKIKLHFIITEQLKRVISLRFRITEKLQSKLNFGFAVHESLNPCFVKFHLAEPQSFKIKLGFLLQEARQSFVNLLFRVKDDKILTKQYSGLTGNPVGILLGDRDELTDYEALGITLIFESDDGT